MPDGPRKPVELAATALWLVFWTAAILIAGALLLRALRDGNLAVAAFLLVWIAAAAFGLYRVGLGFAGRLTSEPIAPERRRRRQPRAWHDDMPERSER